MVIDTYRPNEALLGAPGSRALLDTPALILDLDALEHNIGRMARLCADEGISLRPHVKTHKNTRIATMQVAAGAVGVCASTVREATVMIAAGIGSVHLTTPLVGDARIRRFLSLLDKCESLSAVVDSTAGFEALNRLAAEHARRIKLFVDVDLQAMYRTGTADAESTLALARNIAGSKFLEYGGIQFYSGIVQHIPAADSRAAFYDGQLDRLRSVVNALESEGLAPSVVTGGGTGTVAIDAASGVITENQAGSYAVMDVEYGDIDLLADEARPFKPALLVQSTVISNNARGIVTIDAGSKSLATDGPTPRVASGAPDGTIYQQFGDEFGVLIFPGAMPPAVLDKANQVSPGRSEEKHLFFYELFGELQGEPGMLDIGAKVELTAPHCDPTINLFNHFHCVRGDTLVEIWPIEARGNL